MPNKPARELEHCRLNSVFFSTLRCDPVNPTRRRMTAVERVARAHKVNPYFHRKNSQLDLYKSFHRARSRAHNTRISNVNSLSLRRDDVGSVGELRLFSLRHKFNALHRRVECCVFFAWNRVSRHRVSICEFSQSAAILLRYLLLHRVQWILAGSDGFTLCAIQSLSPSKTRAGSSRAAESIHSWNFKYFTI